VQHVHDHRFVGVCLSQVAKEVVVEVNKNLQAKAEATQQMTAAQEAAEVQHMANMANSLLHSSHSQVRT
jgi:hypothetical protein